MSDLLSKLIYANLKYPIDADKYANLVNRKPIQLIRFEIHIKNDEPHNKYLFEIRHDLIDEKLRFDMIKSRLWRIISLYTKKHISPTLMSIFFIVENCNIDVLCKTPYVKYTAQNYELSDFLDNYNQLIDQTKCAALVGLVDVINKKRSENFMEYALLGEIFKYGDVDRISE
jgi:hypothetical protein